MRPIPWILVSGLLVASGIVFTWEGQTSIRPVPVIASREAPDIVPSRWRNQGAPRVAIPGVPDVDEPEPLVPYKMDPEVVPPVSDLGESFLCGKGHHLLTALPGGKFRLHYPFVNFPRPEPTADGEEPKVVPLSMERHPQEIESIDAVLDSIKAAIRIHKEPDVPFRLTYVASAATPWSAIRPVLDHAAAAGLKRIGFCVRKKSGEGELHALWYDFYDEGPVLPPRAEAPTDGGVLILKVGGRGTYFGFQAESETRALKLAKSMRAWNKELLELEDADYADSGRAWTLRAFPKSSYEGIVQGITALRKIGFKRCGIEAAPE